MGIFKKLLGKLRRSPDEQGGTWVEVDGILTAKILGYAGLTSDRRQIREAVVRRYGTTLQVIKDAETGIHYEAFVRKSFQEQMAVGQIETVSIKLGHKIVNAHATLFTEPTQNFALIGPEGVDTSTASELLDEMRHGEQYTEKLAKADGESLWVGSILMFPEFVDGRMRYRTVDPGKIKALFHAAIESNEQLRPVDHQDIEDATCVVIETGSVDDTNRTYIAIYGRSEKYPNGRYVSYTSGGDGKEVPDVGTDDNAYEWRAGESEKGEIANPLSLYANNNPELELPEYPLVIFYGGHVKSDQLFPVSGSLLEESLEADIAATRVRATSIENAKGTRSFTKSEDGQRNPVPKSLRGDVILGAGEKLENVDADSAAPRVAWELLQEENTSSAQGWSVPDFWANSKDHTVEAASGAALRVRSMPLGKFRGRRARINAPSVHRLFAIEKALIFMFADRDESVKRLLQSCDQTWDPGVQDLPVDDAALDASIQTNLKAGIYDTIEAIRVRYNLASEAEAIEKYEQLAKRAKKYPPLNNTEANKDQQPGEELPGAAIYEKIGREK